MPDIETGRLMWLKTGLDIDTWVYQQTLEDLKQRVDAADSASTYDLLGIAVLLRRLLLDGETLVARLNVTHRLRISYAVRPHEMEGPRTQDNGVHLVPLLLFASDLNDPEATPVSLNPFLSTVIGQAQLTPITVKDLILYYANIEGGVHLGTPRTETQKALLTMATIAGFMSHRWVAVLAELGAIVLDGLTELTAIVAKTDALLERDMGGGSRRISMVVEHPGQTFDWEELREHIHRSALEDHPDRPIA